MEKFDIVKDEETGEVTAVKYGEKTYTAEEWERVLERDKNLEAGYSKKFNELDKKAKELEAEVENARKLEALMTEHPELEKDINEILEKHVKGKKNDSGAPVIDNKAMEKIEALEKRIEEKERSEKMNAAMTYYDGKIKETLAEVNIKSEKAAKAISDTTYTWLMAQTEKPTDQAIKDYIKGCVDDFKADLGGGKKDDKKPVKPPPNTPIPGKGGQGGASAAAPKYIKPGTQEHEDLKAQARQEFIRKQQGET